MDGSILLVYPTYDNNTPPRVLSLNRDFTSEQFLKFVTDLAGALNKPQGGYDHVKVTVAVLMREEGGWAEKLKVEI